MSSLKVVLLLTFTSFLSVGALQGLPARNHNQWHNIYSPGAVNDVHLRASVESRTYINKSLVELIESFRSFWLQDVNGSRILGDNSGLLTQECMDGALQLVNTTDPLTGLPLIIRMVDAVGKIGSGILDGNIFAFGAYDECFGIGPGYTGYCLLELSTSVPRLVLGICVPKGCIAVDVANVISVVSGGRVSVRPSSLSCVSTRNPPFNTGTIIMIVVCCVFVALVTMATITDLIIWYIGANAAPASDKINCESDTDCNATENDELLTKVPVKTNRLLVKEIVVAFSLCKVLLQILSTEQPPSAISGLNGLRVVSMFWLILCHTHSMVTIFGADNILNFSNLKDILSRFTFQAIGNGFFVVDSFFFISGLLVAYLTLHEMQKRAGRFPFLTYYLHRFLRLTPTYAFVLFFVWLLTMHLADGPIYHHIAWEGSGLYHNCRKYWWTNLLYINSLYPWKLDDECIGWTWYLANDMQFYILSPLILVPFYFLFPLGLAISSVVLTVCFAISGALAGVYDYQALDSSNLAYGYAPSNTDTTQPSNLLYIKPWHRVSPYIVGLVLGYILYRFRLPTTKHHIHFAIFPLLLVLSGILLALPLYGLYPQWHGHTPSKVENVIYFMFSRFSWSLGLAFLVFTCHYGYGGPINWFLSLKFWIPLNRLCYCAYLLHFPILLVIHGSERSVIHYRDYNLVVLVIAAIVLTFGASAIVAVFIEFPIGNLEQALFKMVGLGRHESARIGGGKDNSKLVPNYKKS